MKCPVCGVENPEGTKFCGECGAPVDASAQCPACGFENAPGTKFCRQCGQALSEPVAGALRTAASSVASQPEPFCDGRYHVVRFLGEGGKKRVFLAHDTKLDRDVAFALIKTDGWTAEGEARIHREAQAMGKLGDHQHIVPVYDIGDEGGQPYLVTQLMGGGDVEGLIEQAPDHRVPLDVALRIADQVCQALEYAHSKGIVHRDLKAGNVWLTADGTAKLGDFGLAVALDRSRLTQTGMMVGTVHYMAPEQAIGGEVTPRSDLYSLGAMLYEMTCGRPPFVGDESVAIITQHLNTPPVAPSWHVPDLPAGLEALILRLLEKDPARRPASAEEVRQALAGVRGWGLGVGEAAPAQPPSLNPQPPGSDPLYGRTFVGREQELRQLQAAFDAALSGQGSLAMVVGEPGIGKTSLCEQLATYVAVRGGRALVGHCYEEGSLSLPYLPFVEQMRSYVLAREPDDLRKDLGSGAVEVARLISEIRDRLQVELRPAGDPEDDRWRLLQAVSGFLRNASTVQPLLLVLEDLHWADRGTLDLLLHVARNLQGARLLIVGNYRDVEVDRAHPLSGALADLRRIGSFQSIRLRGLSIDEVQRMMTNIRGQEVPWSRAEAIHRQTEGNPLFVQEVLRYLVEEGLVVREGGRYALADPSAPEAGIPEGLRDVIGKRLSRLSPECNRLLAIAAVVGRDFNLETLRAVAGVDEEALVSALEESVRIGVLDERSQPGRVVYRFAHAFFRQTLYEEMIAPRRLRLHQEVARALEAQYGTRREEHAAELAEHCAQSTDRADLAKAVEYGELAARRAMGVYAYAEAAAHLERCIAVQEVLDPDDAAKRCNLLLDLGEALMPVGELRRAIDEVAPAALALAEAMGNELLASRACGLAIEALTRYGAGAIWRTQEFRAWAERADRYAAPGTRERVTADIALAQARSDWTTYRRADVRALRRHAVALARDLDEPQILYTAVMQTLANYSTRPDEALELAEEFSKRSPEGVSTRSPEGVSTRTFGTVLWESGRAFLISGDRGRAEDLFREAEGLATHTRDAAMLLLPIKAEAALATIDGRLEEAVAAGERLTARAEELGQSIAGRHFANQYRLRALLLLGSAEQAWEGLFQAFRMAGLEDEGLSEPSTRAVVLAHLGRVEEACGALREGLANFGPEDDQPMAYALPLLLETAVLTGDREAAAAALASWPAHLAALVPVPYAFTCIARHLGAASALLGKPDEARAYYLQALEACAKLRFRPEIALTRLDLAELLLEQALTPTPLAGSGQALSQREREQERAEALEHLDFAIAEFREMKMQPSLERALRHKGLLHA